MVAASKLRAIQTRAENSRGLWQPFTALLGDTPSKFMIRLSGSNQILESVSERKWWKDRDESHYENAIPRIF